jgi:ribosomal protein S18 acetylase RimI-like enzyme
MDRIYLRVFADNQRAVALYRRCGFTEFKRSILVPLSEGGVTRWVEAEDPAPGASVRLLSWLELLRR